VNEPGVSNKDSTDKDGRQTFPPPVFAKHQGDSDTQRLMAA